MHSEHTPPVFLLSHFFPSMQHGGSWEADLHQITVKLWYSILHGISPLPVSLSASEDSSHTLSINYRLERAHVVRSKGQQERPSVCVHSQTHAQGPPAPFNMLWAASFSLSISLFLLSVSLCSNDGWFPVAVSYRFSTHLCSKRWVCVCSGNNIRQNWLVTLWSLLRFSLYWRRLFRGYICKCCSTQLNYQGNYKTNIYNIIILRKQQAHISILYYSSLLINL